MVGEAEEGKAREWSSIWVESRGNYWTILTLHFAKKRSNKKDTDHIPPYFEFILHMTSEMILSNF